MISDLMISYPIFPTFPYIQVYESEIYPSYPIQLEFYNYYIDDSYLIL